MDHDLNIVRCAAERKRFNFLEETMTRYIMKLNGEIVNTTNDDSIANWWLEMVGITKNNIEIGCETMTEEEYKKFLTEQNEKAWGK